MRAFDTWGDLGVTLTVLKGTQLISGYLYDAFEAIPKKRPKVYFFSCKVIPYPAKYISYLEMILRP